MSHDQYPYSLNVHNYSPTEEEILRRQVARLEREINQLKTKLNLLYGMVKPLIEFEDEKEKE